MIDHNRDWGGHTMPHDATVSSPADLSPSQTLALAALLSGATVTVAAERAGVGRETVHRWLREDAAFIANYNAEKAAVVAAARAELRSLAALAVARLRTLLEDKHPFPRALALQYRAAIDVLKMTGVAEPETIAPLDARPAPACVRIVEVPAYRTDE